MASYTLSSPGMVLRMMMSAGRAFDPPAPRYGVRLAGPPPERMTPARARVLEAAKNGLIWVKSSLAEAAGVSPGVIDGPADEARGTQCRCWSARRWRSLLPHPDHARKSRSKGRRPLLLLQPPGPSPWPRLLGGISSNGVTGAG